MWSESKKLLQKNNLENCIRSAPGSQPPHKTQTRKKTALKTLPALSLLNKICFLLRVLIILFVLSWWSKNIFSQFSFFLFFEIAFCRGRQLEPQTSSQTSSRVMSAGLVSDCTLARQPLTIGTCAGTPVLVPGVYDTCLRRHRWDGPPGLLENLAGMICWKICPEKYLVKFGQKDIWTGSGPRPGAPVKFSVNI